MFRDVWHYSEKNIQNKFRDFLKYNRYLQAGLFWIFIFHPSNEKKKQATIELSLKIMWVFKEISFIFADIITGISLICVSLIGQDNKTLQIRSKEN